MLRKSQHFFFYDVNILKYGLFMSYLRIDKLNFITSGSSEKLINVDLMDEYGNIDRNVTFVAGIDEKQSQFTYNGNKFSMYDTNNDILIHPLYDIKDCCIKSAIQKTDITGKTQLKSEDYIDIYAPQLYKNPIGVCQNGNYSYVLTEQTNTGPVFLRTDLYEQREENTEEQIEDNTYKWENKQYNLNTYVYDSCYSVKTELSSHFIPKYNLKNIEYNYVMEIPQNFKFKNMRNDYAEGNIQGDIFQCKNTYNSTYSMEMTSQNVINNSREYTGIGVCGGIMFLKYIDNVDYTGTYDNLSSIEMYKVDRTQNKYVYPKIETVDSINRFKKSTQHRTNLFSVSITNTRFDTLNTNDKTKELKNKIIMDIKNNIRDICSKVAPANTQLFDVFFEGDEN